MTDKMKEIVKNDEYYQKALEANPNDIEALNEYAGFLALEREDNDGADALYQRALAAAPNDLKSLNNYALFQANIQRDIDKAEEIFGKALEIAPNDAETLSTYANFQSDSQNDQEKAEEYYKKAMEAAPDDATIISNFAIFLCLALQDFERAEPYFRRTMELEPDNSQHPINFAAFLLIQGNKEEGKAMLDRAEAMDDLQDVQQVAIAFHRYIHFPDVFPTPLKKLKRLLKSGKRALDWTFDLNIERAEKDKHHNMPLLRALAGVIAGEKVIKTLDAAREWRIA